MSDYLFAFTFQLVRQDLAELAFIDVTPSVRGISGVKERTALEEREGVTMIVKIKNARVWFGCYSIKNVNNQVHVCRNKRVNFFDLKFSTRY